MSKLIVAVTVLQMSLLVGCNTARQHDDGSMGLFSVSATGQVEFSPGNLEVGGRSFVAHQWDYGWLFGWGTGDRCADTSDNWHVEGDWRSLTGDEWYYLLFERKDADQKRAVGTVNEMHGLLLLPDEWELPSGCSFDCKARGWDVNCYSVEDWELLEMAGAVFLPAAGFRWGEMPYAFNCEGLYWSSTTQSEGCPYTMHFDGNILAVDWDNTPQFGQSVRLVRDCK